MLSKHLYELPAICATLIYSFQTGNTEMALYAAKELHDSNEDNLLFSILTYVWLLSDSNNKYELNRYNAFVTNNIESFIMSLIVDNTPLLIPSILPAKPYITVPPVDDGDTKTMPCNWSIYPKKWTINMATKLARAITGAIKKHNIERCVTLTAQLIDSNNIKSLSNLLQSFGISTLFTSLFKKNNLLKYRILEHAFAIIIAYQNNSDIHIFLNDELAIWRSVPDIGIKLTERKLIISADALNFWNIRVLPRASIFDILYILKYDDSIYWSSIREKYITDEEKYYKTIYPDDIPDEWSDEELNKSHPIYDLNMFKTNPWIDLLKILPTDGTSK